MAAKRQYRLKMSCSECGRAYCTLKPWLKHQSKCRAKVGASFSLFLHFVLKSRRVEDYLVEAAKTGRF